MSTILDSLKKSSNSRGDGDNNAIDNFSFSDNYQARQSKIPVFFILLILTLIILYFGYQYLFADTINTPIKPIAINSKPLEISEQTLVSPKLLTNKNTTKKIEKPNSKDVKKILKNEAHKDYRVAQKTSNEISRTSHYNEKSFQNLNKPLANQTEITKKNQDKIKRNKAIRVSEYKINNQSNIQHYKLAYQLPFAIRKDLPELILNIHVYDENANNRIAIINGEKFEVNALIADEILVKEIVLEGVVLEFKNTTFLLPKL